MNKVFLSLALAFLLAACNSAYQTPVDTEPTKKELNAAEKAAREQERDMALSFATEYKKQGAYRDAANNYTKVFSLDQDLEKAAHLKYWSLCYSQLSMPDSALLVMELAVSKRPEEHYERVSLARLYENANMDAKALAEYREAVKLKPDDENSWKSIKTMLAAKASDSGEAEDWKAVLDVLDTLIALNPDETSYLEEKTRITKRNFSTGDIIVSLEEQVAADPTNTRARLELARAYVDFASTETYQKARVLLEGLSQEQPENEQVFKSLADCLIELDDINGAISALKTLDTLKGGDEDTMVRIGNLYLELRQLKVARSWGSKARAKAPGGKGLILLAQVAEASVDECSDGPLKFYDKLAYELAANYYSQVTDPGAKAQARNRRDALEPVLPTKGDRFLNQGKTLDGHPCYGWLLE
ncbi:MAG: tetratricopeptide repeat protein [Calditrichaeota bacterium]|nr:tetratricopeptide repeat protein [Candidatus Cloacimonadota bacterium]MCB1046965.1 tetratricopeptide repeat protein [Calditrichota bacterium]MCB9475191.1 tetratricopeptide repeat protein [Candidatus Delongbacteria bacterium]